MLSGFSIGSIRPLALYSKAVTLPPIRVKTLPIILIKILCLVPVNL